MSITIHNRLITRLLNAPVHVAYDVGFRLAPEGVYLGYTLSTL